MENWLNTPCGTCGLAVVACHCDPKDKTIAALKTEIDELKRYKVAALAELLRFREALEHIAGNMEDKEDVTYCQYARGALEREEK